LSSAIVSALALMLMLAASAARGSERASLLLELETPAPGAVIGGDQGLAFVSGQALVLHGGYRGFDIVFVIDTSATTADPAGSDVDGDGRVSSPQAEVLGPGFDRILPVSNDRGDTILAAEIQAVRTLLGQLDPRTTRVGLVSFAGDRDPSTLDASTEAALTAEYDQVEAALARILRRGPKGQTNMVDGMNLALGELMGTQSARSSAREGVRRIIMFLTDGHPTLPLGDDLQNAKLAIERAGRARQLDVRVDTYALGAEALGEPLAAVEMALVTGGVFTPVMRPSDLETVFEELSFADIETLELTNRTNGTPARRLQRNADGSFAALLALQEGPNVLELHARASDGSESRRQVQVTWTPAGQVQPLDARQLAAKNRLLESELLELRRRNVDIEADRDEKIRAALREEIVRERRKAEAKAAEARKRLEIEVEKP
jgi:hypothetical protein